MHKTLRRKKTHAKTTDPTDPAHGRAVQTRGFIVTDAVDQGLEIMVIVYFCLKFK
jgi:hypothetical protein